MLKTKDERWEALMEYLDEGVHYKLDEIMDYVEDTLEESYDEFYMDQKEIKEFIDEVWVRCFLGKRGKK